MPDLTLNKLKVAGIPTLENNFGTKKKDFRGLTAEETMKNMLLPFEIMRPYGIAENCKIERIEHDAKLEITTPNIQLELGEGAYTGLKLDVIANFKAGNATIVYGKPEKGIEPENTEESAENVEGSEETESTENEGNTGTAGKLFESISICSGQTRTFTWNGICWVGNSTGDLRFNNIAVPVEAWTESSEHTGFDYEAVIELDGVSENLLPDVNFAYLESISGVFADFAESIENGVKIYANKKPVNAIIILEITCK